MRRKHAVVGVVVAVLSVGGVVGASAGGDAGKPPIHFALIGIQIPSTDVLGPRVIGANAAANQINAHGGFGGRKVVVDVCNSQLNPAVATVCANQTLAKHPVAEFGCEVVWSASGLAIYGRAGVPSFNCPNTQADFTYRWSFGLQPGAFGEQRAMARYLCSRPDVKHVVMFGQDITQQRRDEPLAIEPVITGCGKTVDFVFAPTNPVDYTPYVQQALQKKPDFVMTTASAAPTALLFKTFQQNGWPASKMSTLDSSCGYTTTLTLAGSAMEGAYCTSALKPWDDTKDPEVAAYIKAVKAVTDQDYRNPTIELGYHHLMWFYTVAKTIGFARFNSKSLTFFMRNRTNVHMPMSRSLVNPGPPGYPQVKQPWVQINQWKNGRLNVAPAGAKKDGWVLGF